MTAPELRKTFLKYFESKNHKIIGSASLIPDNDPTVLFTTAGMHPLVPYLMGEKHPEGKRLTSVQKCIRTGDIDEVGDATHHTFFEMLGNWSLGDYFKKETIEFSWEFLTEVLGIKKEKLAVTVFAGDQNVPRDEESAEIWKKIGVNKIGYLGKKDNWWGPAGQTGPCGPDTEIFYWTGTESAPNNFDPEDTRWVELWNDVIMQYNKTADGKYEPLKQKNIDTGMGFERTLAVLNGFDDNYLTELWQPIIKKIEDLSGKKYKFEKGDLGFDEKPDCWDEDVRSMRIIADHIRSAIFIMGDAKGIAPGNKDQNYVLRRLIRRAIRFAFLLGIKENFCLSLAETIINLYKSDYPELIKNKEFINSELSKEEEKFRLTMQKGRKKIHRLVLGFEVDPIKELAEQKRTDVRSKIIKATAKDLFIIFSTYGFPLEMSLEEIKFFESHEFHTVKIEDNIEEKFEAEFKKHQELSRTASAGMFKGGLADDGEMSRKYHTATHLLHQALRDILGDHVEQKGSNINEKRLRFDFVHPDKLTDEEKQKVEELVNQQIQAGLEIVFEEMSVAQAKEQGAIGLFDKKYGEMVKVYKIGKFSKEICGGPHVENTNELGTFKIKKEQSSSAGIRRIKATLK